MIFVTVGTHEQQFNRLIQCIDQLKLDEEVFVQTGYSTYVPKNFHYKQLIGYEEMWEYSKRARIIITHGGPGSIMLAMQQKKIPIVVPRQQKYGEHINDHQVDFAKRLDKEGKIIAVYDIHQLANCISRYEEISAGKAISIYANQYADENAVNYASQYAGENAVNYASQCAGENVGNYASQYVGENAVNHAYPNAERNQESYSNSSNENFNKQFQDLVDQLFKCKKRKRSLLK